MTDHVERLTRWRDERIPSHSYQLEGVEFRRDVIALLDEVIMLRDLGETLRTEGDALITTGAERPSDDVLALIQRYSAKGSRFALRPAAMLTLVTELIAFRAAHEIVP